MVSGCRLLHVLLAALVFCPTGRAAESDIRRTFQVLPGCTLFLDSYSGDVTVEETGGAEIRLRLEVDVEAGTDEEAQRLRDELRLEMTSVDNQVRITARNSRESGLRLTARQGRLQLNYRISVPHGCHVDLRIRTGAITVESLSGRVVGKVENGSLFCRRIDGTINASVDFGDVIVGRCTGAVTANVLKGAIRLGTIGGGVEARNATGNIEIMTAKAGVTAAAEAGDVTVGFGPTVVSESRLTTSRGNIVVTLDPRTAIRVEASSRWGRVQTDLPFVLKSGASGKSQMSGQLNGGGPLLIARADGGQVRIKGGEAPFD